MAGPSSADATERRLAELDRQVERGSRFTHASLEKGFNRLTQAEILLAELVAALDARGLVPAGELGVSLVDEDPPTPEPQSRGAARACDPSRTRGPITADLLAEHRGQGRRPRRGR